MHRLPGISFVLIILAPILLSAILTAGAPVACFIWSGYQAFLDRHVSTDRTVAGFSLNLVDYKAINWDKEDQSSLYRRVLEDLAAFDPASLNSREGKVAFWINVYNIGAIKMIVDHYPVDSIRSRSINWLKNPWDKEIITVGGTPYSLGEVEHGTLLAELKEPMAHFTIVCASLSCPEIAPDAYLEATVKEQMEARAVDFLKDDKKGLKIDREKGVVHFSQIFKFDKKTFPDGGRSAVSFISPFIPPDDADYLRSGDYKVKYLGYDWSVNSLERADQPGPSTGHL